MPDWTRFVSKRLAAMPVARGAREDIIAELALHLEETYEQARSTGVTGRAAVRFALQEVDDWRALTSNVCRAKQENAMNRRTKTLWLPLIAILFTIGLVLLFLGRAPFLQQLIFIACMVMFLGAAASEANRLSQRTRSLWLPAMMNLTLSFGLFIILDGLNLDEPGIALAGNLAKAFRIPWLLPLPVLGAVGALLARRAQASRAERVIAGLAPSLVWLAVLAVIGLILVLDRRDFGGVPLHDFMLSAVGLVILPAVALLLGVLPFLPDPKPVVAQD